jgi:hypothetical protein
MAKDTVYTEHQCLSVSVFRSNLDKSREYFSLFDGYSPVNPHTHVSFSLQITSLKVLRPTASKKQTIYNKLSWRLFFNVCCDLCNSNVNLITNYTYRPPTLVIEGRQSYFCATSEASSNMASMNLLQLSKVPQCPFHKWLLSCDFKHDLRSASVLERKELRMKDNPATHKKIGSFTAVRQNTEFVGSLPAVVRRDQGQLSVNAIVSKAFK